MGVAPPSWGAAWEQRVADLTYGPPTCETGRVTDAELLPTAFQTRRRHRLFAELDNNGRLVRCGAYHRGRALAELEVLEHGVRARYDAADHTEHFDAGEVSRSTAWDGEGDSGVDYSGSNTFIFNFCSVLKIITA